MLRNNIKADKVDVWAEMIDRSFRAHVTLMVEPASATEFKNKLKATDAFKIKGVAGSSYVGDPHDCCII